MANCIFCDRLKCPKARGAREAVTSAKKEKKQEIIETLKSLESSQKVHLCEKADDVKYHKSCLYKCKTQLKEAQSNSTPIEENEKTSENEININKKVFEQLTESIEEKIIRNRETWALSGIFNLYNRLFLEEKSKCSHNTSTSMKSHHLLEKILKSNDKISKTLYKNRVCLHVSDMDTKELLQKGFEVEDSITAKIRTVGMALRKEILEMDVKKLPKRNISVKHIIDGECEVPEKLYALIECIVESPRTRENQDSIKQNIKRKKIQSICDSIILTATSGKCKPASSLQLALTVKSLTGSKQLIQILNRMGFSPSYLVTEELETELAYACAAENRILPYNFNNNIITNVAFDNFDRYVETANGKDTLHDTVGIAVQNRIQMNEEDSPSIELLSINNASTTNQRRRRQYLSAFDSTMLPYTRQNQLSLLLRMNEIDAPNSWTTAIDSNLLWMMSCALRISEAKQWYVWHSQRIVTQSEPQIVGYLPVINQSPTNDVVVMKTMCMALEIADQCNQQYIIVTYDLAIAMKALTIKAQKPDEFERLFINLGPFHIELSYFKVSIPIALHVIKNNFNPFGFTYELVIIENRMVNLYFSKTKHEKLFCNVT